jgi:hypothetical protein
MEQFLATLLFGHHDIMEGADERGPIELAKAVPFDTGATSIDPIGEFLEKAELNMLTKSDESWDTQLTPAAPLAKALRGTPRTYPVGSIGHKLQIVSVEELTIDSGIGPEKWVYGYNAAGKLVDARLVREEAT